MREVLKLSDNQLTDLFNNPLIKDYLAMNDELIRLVATTISAESELINNKATEGATLEKETETIIAMCGRLMQISELYSMLTGVIKGTPSLCTVELNEFLNSFIKKCGDILDGLCIFESVSSDIQFINTSKDILTYILLSYIRTAILDGAKKIRFEYGVSNGMVCVIANVIDSKRQNHICYGDFSYSYNDDILKFLAERISAEYSGSESGMTLSFIENIVSSDSELHSIELGYESQLFSQYRIMLGDLPTSLDDK